MELARRTTDQLDGNGSAPVLLAMPTPSEAEMRARVVRTGGLPAPGRPSGATLAALATLAGIGALALGSWAFVTDLRADGDRSASESGATVALEQAVALLSSPGTQRLPLAGSEAEIVLAVGAGSRAVLALDGLEEAPAGKEYLAWLIGPNGRVTASAGVFTGDETVVPLTELVPSGSGVGVTLEPSGARAPTRRITRVAVRP